MANAVLVASICLYGRRPEWAHVPRGSRWTSARPMTAGGYAALTQIAGAREINAVGWTKLAGGEERPNMETATEAIWLAVSDLRARGVEKGLCRIFDSGGTRYVDVALESHVPSYGGLGWRSIDELPVMTISAEEIIGASS